MNVIAPAVLDYYETFLRVAETENLKVQVPPAEMRAFIAAARAAGGADRLRQGLNEEETRLVRMAGAAGGIKVAAIRAAFARLRSAAVPYV